MPIQNYHKHDHVTNIVVPDSIVTMEDYAKRASELGHTILSSCNHGTQGNYRECADLAAKYGLKWRYVTEAYFVKDRFQPDRTNAHIVLAAKTEKGIGDLNEALSEANLTGYYYHPRVDLDILLSLDPRDVFVTTACIGGVWKYGLREEKEGKKVVKWWYEFDEPDSIVRTLHQHFRDSFMLEVQNHHTDEQRVVNRHILDLYRELGIPLICGLDSHFITPEQADLRTQYLESRHLVYDHEDGWFMDYPSDDVIYQRFVDQGVLSSQQIREAMDNTNVFLDFQDVALDKSKKLPTLYPNLTQEERNQKYRALVREKWKEYRADVPRDRWPEYEAGIAYEVDTITSTNTSDYFLIDYELVRRGRQKGGMFTFTGRGSGPSYFTNTLLGLSSIDRFALPVTMYPDRFISKERLMAGSMPDLDMNCGTVEPFIQAQSEIMGEYRSAPMVAFGTLKRLSAWKMYCRASNVPFEISNAISESLKQYELDVKHADEDDKDSIDVFEYVPQEYHEQLRMSEKYLGMVDSISPHPCAHLLCCADIRREIGLYRINSGQGSKKKIVYAAFIDGATADAYGYLKNDILKVDVVKVNAEVFQRIGIPQPSAPELLSLTAGDQATWSMYAKGFTIGLNQAEKEKSTEKVMRYKPKNISEMSAFVAGIRPAFQSMINTLLDRRHFEYGIPALDKLLQTPEMPSSFILYQEQMMTILQYAGFSAPESYASIKAIAKKHPEKVLPLKERFLEGFRTRLVNDEGISSSVASETADKVWVIISDACGYGFNSSHSVSVGLDSLYGAYAKAHYPLEYYTTLLSNYALKGDKDRIALAKSEMKKAFGIRIVPCRFRQDNRDYYIDKENNAISDALTSVKHISARVAKKLYDMRNNHYDCFVDLLYDLEMDPVFDATNTTILIKMGYFREFGASGKLLKLYHEFREGKSRFSKTHVKATQEKRLDILRHLESTLPEEEIPAQELLKFEADHYGMPISEFKSMRGWFVAVEVDDKYSPKIKLYNASNGNIGVMKVKKPLFNRFPIKAGDVLRLDDWSQKPAYQYVDGKSRPKPGVFDLWINSYTLYEAAA